MNAKSQKAPGRYLLKYIEWVEASFDVDYDLGVGVLKRDEEDRRGWSPGSSARFVDID